MNDPMVEFVRTIHRLSERQAGSDTAFVDHDALTTDELDHLNAAIASGFLSTDDHYSLTGTEIAIRVLPLAKATFSLRETRITIGLWERLAGMLMPGHRAWW